MGNMNESFHPFVFYQCRVGSSSFTSPPLFLISRYVNKCHFKTKLFFFAPHDTSVCGLCGDPAAVVGVLYGELFKAPAEFQSSRHL